MKCRYCWICTVRFLLPALKSGGSPFAGWELLSAGARPVWAMTYYGLALERPGQVLAALRAAMLTGLDNGEWGRGPLTTRSGTRNAIAWR